MPPIITRDAIRRRVPTEAPTIDVDVSSITAGEAALGEAISRIGGTVAQVGAEMATRDAKLKREEDENIASEAFQSAFPRVADSFNNISTGRDIPTLSEEQRKMPKLERYQSNFDTILDEVAADLTPEQREIFEKKITPTQLSNVKTLSRQEAVEAQAVRAINYKDESSLYSEALLDNPNGFDTYIAAIPIRLEGAGIVGSSAKEVQSATEAQYAQSAIRGIINQPTKLGDPLSGPGAAIAAIDSGRFDEYLDQKQREQMKKEAETYQKVFKQREKDKQKAKDAEIVDGWLVRMINGEIPDPQDLANPELSKDGRKELLGLAKTYGTGGAKAINNSDADTYNEVQNLLYSSTPGEITTAEILGFKDKGLGAKDAKKFIDLNNKLIKGEDKETVDQDKFVLNLLKNDYSKNDAFGNPDSVEAKEEWARQNQAYRDWRDANPKGDGVEEYYKRIYSPQFDASKASKFVTAATLGVIGDFKIKDPSRARQEIEGEVAIQKQTQTQEKNIRRINREASRELKEAGLKKKGTSPDFTRYVNRMAELNPKATLEQIKAAYVQNHTEPK
jgi:hypothetical protein